jgi:hypothetical protein
MSQESVKNQLLKRSSSLSLCFGGGTRARTWDTLTSPEIRVVIAECEWDDKDNNEVIQ